MSTVIEFPIDVLPEATHDWNVIANTAGVGITNAAVEDVRSDGGGIWLASLNNVMLSARSHVLLWRALRQVANGGVGRLIVPRIDRMQPFPPGQAISSIPHGDGAFFDDGAGYTQMVIDVVAGADAPLRATTMILTLNNCDQLLGGEVFSIQHPTWDWRLYEIGTVTEIDDDSVSVTFNPPLREAVPAGTPIEFDRPRCLMKLAAPNAMDLPLSALPCLVTAKFVEAKFAS